MQVAKWGNSLAVRLPAAVVEAPLAVTVDTHDDALRLAQRYGFHFHDALVVASALAADCETLYTEDLQDGQVIDDRLTVRNPFKRTEA